MDIDAEIYRQGKALLGKNVDGTSAGAYLTKLKRAINNDAETLECIRMAARKTEGREPDQRKEDVREILGGCLRARKKVEDMPDHDEIRKLAGTA